MSVDIGYLAIMREIKENEYYKDPLTMRLYEHLLIDANFKDSFWKGILIKRGQKVTSLQNLSSETGLTIKQVRTALDKLIKSNYVVKKGTNKYTLLTLVEYESITLSLDDEGKQMANKRQTKGKQRATIEESNKNNKENKLKIESESNKNSLSSFDFLNSKYENEMTLLIKKYKSKINDWDFLIGKFNFKIEVSEKLKPVVFESYLKNWIKIDTKQNEQEEILTKKEKISCI